ncbi:hypothetical protein ABZ801_13270 [Actinomadura sp. NPDC047616]|uniref:hypothetical protein n=1 Tax=Actinomadura sp. NPDC047616 TaxID=3155914 RepID=UPI0033C5E770
MFNRDRISDMRAGRHRRPRDVRDTSPRYGAWTGMALLAATAGVAFYGIVGSLDAGDDPLPVPQSVAIQAYPSRTPSTTPDGIVPRNTLTPSLSASPERTPRPEPPAERPETAPAKSPGTPADQDDKPGGPGGQEPSAPSTPSTPPSERPIALPEPSEPAPHAAPRPGIAPPSWMAGPLTPMPGYPYPYHPWRSWQSPQDRQQPQWGRWPYQGWWQGYSPRDSSGFDGDGG